MLFRKDITKIEEWYFNLNTALLVEGARQVGKTFLINYFLNKNVKHFVSFNLIEDSLAREAFNTSNNADELLLKIISLSDSTIYDDTVFFFDEIQAANDALTPVKFLVNKSSYRFIFSGSLLGVELKNIKSIPAGSLTSFTMYPLDFEEFMIANDINQITFKHISDSYNNETKVDDIIHKKLIKLFNLYLIIGGFPKAVESFIKNKNINIVSQIQRDIDYAYKFDVSQYDNNNNLLIKDIYDLIPAELSNQNKRFVFDNLSNNTRFSHREDSFVWFKNSGIGLMVNQVNNPKFPLLSSQKNSMFKLFLCDVGLLTYKLYGNSRVHILNGDILINYGSIYENVVAQELVKNGFRLYYLNKKKYGEVDFLIELNGEVLPIEVKSGKDYKRHSALTNLLNQSEFNINKAIVLSNGNVEKKNNILYLPIYMIIYLKDKLAF